MQTSTRPQPGEPVPWFVGRSLTNPQYHFSMVAGRHIVLFFPGPLGAEPAASVHASLMAARDTFDDARCSLFVVACDESDVTQSRAADHIPGIRVLCDYDAAVSRQFGVAREGPGGQTLLYPSLVLLDPTLRVMQWFNCTRDQPNPAPALLDVVRGLPPPLAGPASVQAPVLIVPRVFEPAFCRELIAHYEQVGGEDSGYMRPEADGIRGVIDYRFKRRMDCFIQDESVRRSISTRISRRLRPEILRAFRFDATRMERYVVACYDAETGGYFRPHRDNEGDGHRQFAVTLNLNEEEYEGGDLRFPEYGRQTYRAPTGGACVFSCGLLHEATPVTRGRRYAFLPFLYDEASARKREANNAKFPDPKHHYRFEPAAAKD